MNSQLPTPNAQRVRGTQPRLDYAAYRSTLKRAPSQSAIHVPANHSEIDVPVYGWGDVAAGENDLTRQHADEPQGQRIVVAGRVIDESGHPVRGALIEVWQANAGGRYRHGNDNHPAPLDPNFTGAGRVVTDDEGRYQFISIKPGAYPWRNHENAWRPAHIHFSVFGTNFRSRLVTQMYFPDDPLFAFDPIYQSIPDERARGRLISRFDLSLTRPEWARGFSWDIVVSGPDSTPFEGRV